MDTLITHLYQIYLQHSCVVTDSRKIEQGCLYVALRGDKFNGNDFALEALEKGAAYAIVDDKTLPLHPNLIQVENGLQTLQQLAKHHRQHFNIPFIAITGSNGKTTTKELVATVLAKKYKTHFTQGNLNNHIGIPLTILSIPLDAEMAVIEMGANHQQEIASYCTYTLPNFGLITNCGKAHLEGFGGEEGVKKGKGELFDFLRTNEGTVFAYADAEYFSSMTKGIPQVLWYGTREGIITATAGIHNDCLALHITKGLKATTIQTHLAGTYNLPNVLAAITIGLHFNVPETDIVDAIEDYIPSNKRSEWITWNTNHILADYYNANPSSMLAAIDNFVSIQANNKLLIIGAMKELGEESVQEHQLIINKLEQHSFSQVVLVGEEFSACKHHFKYCVNAAEAATWFASNQWDNYFILIKGSRGIALEKIVQQLGIS